MPKGPKHHRCQRGAKVMVVLRSGERIFGKFHEQNDRFCKLKNRRIPWRNIRTFTIYKGDEGQWDE